MNFKAIIYCVLQGVLAILVFWLCLHLVGCRCPECVTTTEVEKTVTVVERDTIIKEKADSASIRARFECDSLNNVLLNELEQKDGKRIKPSIDIKKNDDGSFNVTFDCKEDSLEHEIHMRDSIISTYKHETTVICEKYVPDYYKFVSWGFWILLVILIALGAWKIARLYLKTQTGGIL